MSSPVYHITKIDHLGLVAGMCQELNLASMVDAILPKQGNHNVSHGQALVAMLLNGLGFHSGTLHMFSQYFADKPVDRFLGADIQAKHLTDDVLGRCLDALYDAGVSELYQIIAEKVVEKLGLTSNAVHLDITSFHVDGAYDNRDGDTTGHLQLVKGYSRDHRPDLNQVILELICENQAGLPVHMRALSGNKNDQKAFAEVSKHLIKCLKSAQNSRYLVADAALYCAESLQALHRDNQLFISRVPATIKEAKEQINQLKSSELQFITAGYRGRWVDVSYAGVPQRWLLVQSEQAGKRESHTLEKNINKITEKEQKAFAKLCKKRFACKSDAHQALCDFEVGLQLLKLSNKCVKEAPVYAGSGRPKKGEQPKRTDYFPDGCLETDADKVEALQSQTGIFILSTNDLDKTLTMEALLTTYKAQQNVERGFRFLKSPEFLVSSLFLKKPERIEALLMVMTCSLMIYAALEYRIRKGLVETKQSIADMKRKPTQKPTARWVFILFMGITELQIDLNSPIIVGLQPIQEVILRALGQHYKQIYS